jgi:hypothetical protein
MSADPEQPEQPTASRYQQKGKSGFGPEASSEAKLAQMTEHLPCARLFWQHFSAVPGCDAADTVHHGAAPVHAPASQALPTCRRRRPRKAPEDRSPRSCRNQFFYNTFETSEEEEDLGSPDDGETAVPAINETGPSTGRVVQHTGQPKRQRVSLRASARMAGAGKVKGGNGARANVDIAACIAHKSVRPHQGAEMIVKRGRCSFQGLVSRPLPCSSRTPYHPYACIMLCMHRSGHENTA